MLTLGTSLPPLDSLKLQFHHKNSYTNFKFVILKSSWAPFYCFHLFNVVVVDFFSFIAGEKSAHPSLLLTELKQSVFCLSLLYCSIFTNNFFFQETLTYTSEFFYRTSADLPLVVLFPFLDPHTTICVTLPSIGKH